MKTKEELELLVEELQQQLKTLKSQKKYGLVWEEQPEDNIDNSKTIPMLINQPDKAVLTYRKKPVNLLIEGDNFHSLKSLLFTHKEKIDVIYIDPPYNTGHKDFAYNDSFVEKEDRWRHSKWLSFMHKRLNLAKKLLSNQGVIFISIDDNEQANLKLLCDEIFGENNFIANIIVDGTPKNDPLFIASSHEYCLVYVKDIDCAKKKEWGLPLDIAKELTSLVEKEKNFDKAELLIKNFYTKNNLNKENISNYKFVDEKGIYRTGPIDDPQGKGCKKPRTNPHTGEELKAPSGGWRCNIDTWNKWIQEGLIKFPDDPNKLCSKKTYLDPNKNHVLKSIMKHQTRKGTLFLKEMFGTKKFNHPKPLELIKNLIKGFVIKDIIVLDFFAGSGTTGHAVLELNKEDGGNRQFILCTNNENNICEEITYERNKRVIQGYTNSKGKEIEGLGGNLKYLKVHNEDISELSDSKKEDIRDLSEQLFIIRENTHYQIHNEEGFSIYSNPEGKITGILYDAKFFEEFTQKLKEYKSQEKALYMFTWSNNTYEELVHEISSQLEQVRFEPIPENILSFYRNHKEVF